jgi:hypothetical protein
VEFFESVPGLAFLHQLVLALHAVFVEIGACGIRLVCLFVQMTGLDRFVGASLGTQQRINRGVEEAMVAYTREETERLAQDMTSKAITVTQDETFTGGLCLGGDRARESCASTNSATSAKSKQKYRSFCGVVQRQISPCGQNFPGLGIYSVTAGADRYDAPGQAAGAL